MFEVINFKIELLFPGEDQQRVRLISVPEFAETYTVCVLNLKNLDCFPINFTSSLGC